MTMTPICERVSQCSAHPTVWYVSVCCMSYFKLKIIIAYGVNYTQWFSSPALLHKSSNKPSENVLAAFWNFEKSVCWGLKSRLDTGGNVAAPMSPTKKYVGLKWFPTSRPIPFPWCLEWCGMFGYDTQWRWRWRPYVRGFRNVAPTQPYGMWAFVVCLILSWK
jgi:hypothetical protein